MLATFINQGFYQEVLKMNRNPIFLTVQGEVADIAAIERHVLCPCYDACLNEAVRKNQYFDCRACLFKQCNIRTYQTHEGYDV